MSLYCCVLSLCPTGTSGVHKSIISTTSGPFGAPVLYGAPRVPPAMHAAVASYYEASAGPKAVQNLLRVKYKHDSVSFLQIPGHPVLRNFLKNLRRKNVVLEHDVAMTGPGPRRPASTPPHEEH